MQLEESNMKNSNKLLLSTFALAIATPAFVIPYDSSSNQVEAATTYAKTFSDVSKKNVYYDITHEMAQSGIISGYEDGTFKPNETISRKHAAALISRAIEILPRTTTFKAPKDLSTNNAYYNDIKKLMEAGLLAVDSKGNINPNKALTRGEMAKILAIAYDLETTGTNPLKDVTTANAKYVSALYNTGVTTGYEDKTFRENETLTRAHYAVFIYRAKDIKRVSAEDIKNMNDEEFKKLTNEQIAKIVLPFEIELYKDIPLPQGQTDANYLKEKLQKEYNAYFVKYGMNLNIKEKFFKESSYSAYASFTDYYNVLMNISSVEAVELVNRAYTTGTLITNENSGVVTDVKFVMFFDYVDGKLHFGLLNK